MRWVYLSPHLDDAVLSAGGWIFEQTHSGNSVEIWTLMCGDPKLTEYSPFADELHAKWRFSSAEETVRMRREEDRRAASIVGATVRHFDFLDCIYRRDSDGTWLYSNITLPPHEADASYPSQIAEAISSLLQPDDNLICQLAVGSHVDHVLVRQAAELLGRPLRYTIDVPYILYKPEELTPKVGRMKESVFRISEAGLEGWLEAIFAYKSQLPVLGDRFDTPEKARKSVQNYWAAQAGIRIFESA